MKCMIAAAVLFSAGASAQIIVDHTCTDIAVIPSNWVATARQELHIAYGHTSHGSQITEGMSGLVAFADGGGKGLSYPDGFFNWNNGGSGGALDLHDYAMGGDVGYYPDWVNNTRTYLNDPANADVNVVMWSWCGQMTGKYTGGTLTNEYLAPMAQLETEYPGVTFVYMTGHADIGDDANNRAACAAIRQWCIDRNKVLFDFNDIEHYNPDGTYFEFVDDACNYYDQAGGSAQGNWALEWQNSHAQNVDWYDCGSAHSEPLNANMKAYAAWWLFARLAGWQEVVDETPPSVPQNLRAVRVDVGEVELAWDPSTDAESGVSSYRVLRNGAFLASSGTTNHVDSSAVPGTTNDYAVVAVNGAGLLSATSSVATVVTEELPLDTEAPTVPENLETVAVSSAQVNLGWDASSDNVGVAGYRVFRDGGELDTTVGTSYADGTVLPGNTYAYQVSAYDASGNESPTSAVLNVVVPEGGIEFHTNRIENTSAVIDTFIFESDPNANHGNDSYVSTIDRFLVRFELPPEMSGRRIVSASLAFFVWNQTNYQTNQFMTVHRVTSPWTESGATWNSRAAGTAWNAPGGDFDTHVIASIEHQQGAANWDHVLYPAAEVGYQVQKWVCQAETNNGFVLINDSLTGIGLKASEYGSHGHLEIIWSDEAAPYLYECWLTNWFSSAEIDDPMVSGRDADPDGDGLANRFEHALGTDPRGTVSSLFGMLDPTTVSNRFGFDFQRAGDVDGFSFDVQAVDALDGEWSTLPAEDYDLGTVASSNGMETVHIDVGTVSSNRFYRLRLHEL